jgi:hypothetical protein
MAFQDFKSTMPNSTPPELLATIESGIIQWTTKKLLSCPTTGSGLPAFQELNRAFEGQTNLGWDASVKGLLCTH